MCLKSKRFLFIFLCLITSHIVNAQQEQIFLRANYILTYQPDSNSIGRSQEAFILEVGKTFSKFQSITIQKKDSLIGTIKMSTNQVIMQNMINTISSLPKTNFRFRIYKFYVDNRVRYIDEVGSHYYDNSNRFGDFAWQIYPNDTATILNYHCQKAVALFAGRHYEAWFTKEVPISDGPYRFCGLPGLIVKINDTKQQYLFTLKDLRDMRSINTSTIQPFKKIATPAATLEIYKGQIQDLILLKNGQAESGIKLSEERKAAISRTLKEFNTRIELK